MAWQEEGILASAIADHLGRHRLSIKHLLAKSRALPKDVIPKRKKGSDCPAMIKIQVLGEICEKICAR